VIGKQLTGAVEPHGKMMIIDEQRAILGSTALSTLSLDFRREVSVVVHQPALVKQLSMAYHALSARAGTAAARLPGDRSV
jgi:phosphatidylserine/phosphatidylglycerophosphate/cardiolipin synthase-like enzyme